jgi:hypothetical protein
MAGIRFVFQGTEWVIPEERAFAAGEAVEEVVTLGEIGAWGDRPKFFKLSRAFAVLAGFAGCQTTPQAVHAQLMQKMADFGAAVAEAKRNGTAPPAADAEAMFVGAALRSLQEVLIQAVPDAQRGKGASGGKTPAVS